ncbi:methylmalonyl Co-A mutase-associated GTPase MeaB [Halopenitus persicus]|uniref:methylmalonyl Co-A mutase-associated GTPase MeaB n=1 Tax=Halopenitus persicus TaxID=1048396 RepID=UPI000BBADB3D|nr:methylmalonyl Co-A mutase-associated GTPase MeaB [Halopenitus persicus]
MSNEDLLEALLAGEHRALARVISKIEDRSPGHRELVSKLYAHSGEADVIGITGSPGAGKSTLVDKLAETYHERGQTVGIIAIDPSSPFSGGAVLGDRIRMVSTVGDMDVFVRSMSARGTLGGLSTATADAVKAMDAFGKDKIIVETVGAGQNEIDVVRTANTVAVLVPPSSGDVIQTLKAGILEIADVFVVNKADCPGADRTVQELREMLQLGEDAGLGGGGSNRHSQAVIDAHNDWRSEAKEEIESGWSTPIVETVAMDGTGIEELINALAAHREYLVNSGERADHVRDRYAQEIRTLLREDVHGLLEDELERAGSVHDLADAVRRGQTDPYTITRKLLDPVETCLEGLDSDRLVDDGSGTDFRPK